MPNTLTADLLDDVAARWRAINAPIASALQPGLSDEELAELGRSVGVWIPPEATTLWRWRNGANLAAIADAGGHTFGSLQHQIGWVATMRSIAEEVADSWGDPSDNAEIAREVWNWGWLPLFHDAVGGMLVIDAGIDARSNLASPVAYRAKDDGAVARPVADSIGSLVHCWIEAIEIGAVRLNPDTGRPMIHEDLLPPGFDRATLGAP